MNSPDFSTNQPVRRNVYAAAVVVSLSTLLGGLSLVDTITVQAVFAALSAALGQFAVIAFGAERAKDQTWGPESVFSAEDALEEAKEDGVLPTVDDA